MTRTVTAPQLFFLPDFHYFFRISQADVSVIADFLRFRKQSPMVRTVVRDGKKPQYLTVPVQHISSDAQPPLSEVKIDPDSSWKQKHLGTLQSLYGRYPYFEYYYPELVSIYEKKHTHLLNLNIDLLQWLLKQFIPESRVIIASRHGISDLDALKDWLKQFSDYTLLIDPREKPYYQQFFPSNTYQLINQSDIVAFPVTYQPEMTVIALLFESGRDLCQYFIK
jgi:hypothetical protein